jgi:hypothetical protein
MRSQRASVLTRLMETLLFAVRPNDPATLAGVAVLIATVAGAASLIPAFPRHARRAARGAQGRVAISAPAAVR